MRSRLVALMLCSSILQAGGLHRQSEIRASPGAVTLRVEFGFDADGGVTPQWLAALRSLRRAPTVPGQQFAPRTPSAEESSWAAFIEVRVAIWATMIDSLRIPFQAMSPPDTVTILLGNQGGEDAFVHGDATICFDLARLQRVYGTAGEPENRDRIDRFFAHEFTHILHKAWRKRNPVQLDTPFEAALWACLTEGVGNYRSLSRKWVTKSGELTPHAETVLARLQPVFVERLAALRHADDAEAPALLRGLSMGPFQEKWGALTVALWLAQEAKGNDANLQKWVAAGPAGVLRLAEKYLPEELQTRISLK